MVRTTGTKREPKAAKVEVVELPAPAEEPKAAYEPRHSSDEDVNLAVKTIDEIIHDLEQAAEREATLEFGDEKMDGHVAANIKALRDAAAKLGTVQKRHGWVKAWIEKATKAAEREAEKLRKAKEREEKAAAKKAAAEKAAAEAAAKANAK